MIPGLIAVISALAVATALGLVWRARNGQVRAYAPPATQGDRERSREPVGAVESAGLVGSAGTSGAAGAELGVTDGAGTDLGVTAADIGTALGSRATLLQFSSAFCAPCRNTHAILTEVAADTDGVTYVEIDAGSRLDLVRRLGVRRTPTTFVLGPRGDVTHRASGEPRKADVIAALGAVI